MSKEMTLLSVGVMSREMTLLSAGVMSKEMSHGGSYKAMLWKFRL
jgi:hypothetical protein